MIIGIDPGTESSAYVLWDGNRIHSKDILRNEELLELIDELWPYCQAAIEDFQCFGMAVGREVFTTVFWAGRFAERFHVRGMTFEKVYRSTIKNHFCHSARAKDANVRQALIDRFGPPGKKASKGVLYGVSKHAWSALAVAVYAHDKTTAQPYPKIQVDSRTADVRG